MVDAPRPAGGPTPEQDGWLHSALGYVVRRGHEVEARAAAAANSLADQASAVLNQPVTRMSMGIAAVGQVVRAIDASAGAAVERFGYTLLDTAFDNTAGAVGRQAAAAVEQVGGRAVVRAAATDAAAAAAPVVAEAAAVAAPVAVVAGAVAGVGMAGAHIATVIARDGVHNAPPSDETAGVSGDATAPPPQN